MKLWDKNNSANEKIIEFTVGDDRLNDLYLIKYDLKASISHAKMLYKTNLLSEIECDRIINILNEMLIEAWQHFQEAQKNCCSLRRVSCALSRDRSHSRSSSSFEVTPT